MTQNTNALSSPRRSLISGSVFSAVLVGAIFLTGCGPEEAPTAPPAPSVTVATPEVREVEVYRSFASTLKGVSVVEVPARVSGYLEETNFEEGGFVEKGDLLFTIEQEPYELAVAAAKADLEYAEAGQQLAAKRLERLRLALESNSVSEVEVDIAAAEMAQSIASVSQAKANLEAAELDLSYTSVHAPISGRISLANVSDENLVGYGEPTVITTIVDDSTIEAYFEIPEREVIRFLRQRADKKVGKHVSNLEIKLELADRSAYGVSGKIDFMDNKIDVMTRTIRLRAIFDNPKYELSSGMYASVQVPIAPNQDNLTETRALLVPADVILRDIGGRYVWVVDDQNVVHRRGVTVGETVVKPAEGDQPAMRQTIVLDGLKPDERIIVIGLQRARDGANVTPTAK